MLHRQPRLRSVCIPPTPYPSAPPPSPLLHRLRRRASPAVNPRYPLPRAICPDSGIRGALSISPPGFLRPQRRAFRPYRRNHLHIPAAMSDQPLAPTTSHDRVESAKRKAAYRAVEDHFTSDMPFVGIGSGSTIVYGVEAIKAHLAAHPPPQGHLNWFVPTGWNSRKVIEAAGLIPIAFESLPVDAMMDVCFDGADEVDDELNCIKGGGACLFQEKLVACRSKKFVCIADYRKDQRRLLTKWPSIPIEVAPIAHASVIRELKLLGSRNPALREHSLSKTGPIQTDQSFYIVDAPFPQLLTASDVQSGRDGSGKDGVYEVNTLALKIKAIHGVLEVGLFHGENGAQVQAKGGQGGQKPVAVYFGMEDGGVSVKKAREIE